MTAGLPFPCWTPVFSGVRPPPAGSATTPRDVELSLLYRKSFHFSSRRQWRRRGRIVRFAHGQPLLHDRKELLHGVIQHHAGGQFVKNKHHHQRHEHHHLLLLLVAGLRRDFHLPDRQPRHEQRQRIDRD